MGRKIERLNGRKKWGKVAKKVEGDCLMFRNETDMWYETPH
jgi:hypothetical protein